MTTTEVSAPHALFEKAGRVGIITLNRPERLNAWSGEMAALIRKYIAECNEDSKVGAIVLTGAGRGFCSGADQGPRDPNREPLATTPPDADQLADFMTRSKPIIAAINGVAVGVGFTLTLACDLRIGCENTRLSARFVRVGLTPEFGSTWFLPQIVGLSNAAEMILTGRIVDADYAQRIGLLNYVVPSEKLMEKALELGEEIAFNPHWHVLQSKRLLYANATESNMRIVHLAETQIFAAAGRTPARQEAALAFREKREPDFHKDD
ncbi:MAG TPA: enoyl-CoA hydratase-related protein [Dehalococcoidia bacterium]|nr:enoyl-CoA hydratase-related protein [Dehalococcoidia bacterium]